jgi:hypothetical protein
MSVARTYQVTTARQVQRRLNVISDDCDEAKYIVTVPYMSDTY